MPLDQKAIIKQIDDILAKYDPSSGSPAEMSKTLSLFLSTLRRLAPSGSVYFNTLGDHEPHLSAGVVAISRRWNLFVECFRHSCRSTSVEGQINVGLHSLWSEQRQRKKVEALFAELKNQIGLRRLRLRRLKFVREQFFLAAAAQNIKRLVRFLSQGPRPPLAVSN